VRPVNQSKNLQLDLVQLWEQAMTLSAINEQPTFQVLDALLVKANRKLRGEVDPEWLWRRKSELISTQTLYSGSAFLPVNTEVFEKAKSFCEKLSLLRLCPKNGWRESQLLVERVKLRRPMTRRAKNGHPGIERDRWLGQHAVVEFFCWYLGLLTLSDEESEIRRSPWELDYLQSGLRALYPNDEIPSEYMLDQ
jgi:hypothetical protein